MKDIFERDRNMKEAELDAKLASEGQELIRNMVKAVPEETVNLAWRSSLNEKLVAAVEAKQRRRRVAWFLSPALGLGLAGALAIVMFTTPSNTSSKVSHRNLEATLVADHRDNVRYTDVTGVGLSPDEVVDGKSVNAVRTEYGEVDLGSL